MKYSTVEFGEGLSSLNDVNAIPPPRRDDMESFWLISEFSATNILLN